MSHSLNPLIRLLLGVTLSLPLCLGLWWSVLREPLVQRLGMLLSIVSAWLWPDTVISLRIQENIALLITLVPPLSDLPQLFMALPVPLNRTTVILPLFWGLTLATSGRRLPLRLIIGTIILLPVSFMMILLDAQFQLALYRTHLPLLTEIPPGDYALALPDSPISYYLSGLGRQLAVLVLPVIAPLLAWLMLHKSFLCTVILGGWLQHANQRPSQFASSPVRIDLQE